MSKIMFISKYDFVLHLSYETIMIFWIRTLLSKKNMPKSYYSIPISKFFDMIKSVDMHDLKNKQFCSVVGKCSAS